MVCATGSFNCDVDEVDIKNYVLEKYVPTKLSEPIYTVSYADDLESLRLTKHAQLQCSGLIWPFCRTGTFPVEVPIKGVQMLAGPDIAKEKCIMELTTEMQMECDYFQPGDTIAVLPSNSSREVQALLERLQLSNKSDSSFQLRISSKCTKKTAKLPPYIPSHCTPYHLLRDCLNFHAIPKKQFLITLANCCGDADEDAFLSCLSSKEGSAYYNELILERGLSLLELLELCPSCIPTLEILIEHLPRLLPRPYSIANSPQTNEIKIIFSIRSQKPGVTTNMLKTLATPLLNGTVAEKLPEITVYPRQTNQFRFTAQEASENNHILIGIGTALAPFLGFLKKKEQLLANVAYTSLGDTWFFAGATTEASLPHRDRILAMEKGNVLQRYFECLSRVPSAPYRYVHDQLLAHATVFVEFLMQKNTILYVCADGGSISKSIEEAITKCLIQVQQITREEASLTLKTFRVSGKYREDLWL
ncbi:PREDICTED: methionine synthase reductase [Rhagoletis zephyria]|uniref:methionine synthase reductase n=1 Tax=Rhagoletis zephyria TaxID=28612 RepID=UPI000811666D|nr:PREDICTED: methionine synthase reductase [Rhagoletis zephyria]